MLTTGNTPDITVAEKLISQIDFKGSIILADRAYGKWEFREFIANHDADFCIPPRKDIVNEINSCVLHATQNT